MEAELTRFLLLVENAWGTDAVLYVGNDFEELYPGREEMDRPLWLRRFLLRPARTGGSGSYTAARWSRVWTAESIST